MNQSSIVFNIKNNTDEKLYNVPVFFVYAEEQNENKFKVKYSSCFKEVEYDDVVKKMRSGFEFDTIIIQSFHGYNIYRQKQLLSQLYVAETANLIHIVQPIVNPLSVQDGIIQVHLNEPIKLSESGQITIEYLMPDAEIRAFFYKSKRKADEPK